MIPYQDANFAAMILLFFFVYLLRDDNNKPIVFWMCMGVLLILIFIGVDVPTKGDL